MLRNSGELVLIDFGTAREETQTYHQKVKGQQVTGITSAGYTPNEQQHGQAVIQSDFHALGRTFVHLLTGKHPLEIYDPINDVLPWREETENIHPLLLDFIDDLMGRLPKNRPANTRVILQRLDEIERQLKLPPITPNRPSPPPPNPQPVVTQKQPPVIPNINPSPPVSPVDKTLTGHSGQVYSLAYSPDGRYLASGSKDRTIKIWEVATGKELRTLTGHSGVVLSVAYSPDGRYLASGSQDKTIKIWEVATGKVRTLTGHYMTFWSVAYSPDGRYLASGSADKTIKIWRVGQ
jgi:WD40 repeat protein